VIRYGLAAALLLPLAAAAQDTTFLTGEELAAQLRRNLVWIAAEDIGEHGYGLVVGMDSRTLWVVTARHVVVHVGMLGSQEPEQPSRQVRLRFCSGGVDAEMVSAQLWPNWKPGGEDLALLGVAVPNGYRLATRALASSPATVGEPVWLLGSNDDCALVPAQGQVRAPADAAHNLRIDFPGVQGGSSGAPILSGRGVLGLMKSAEDLTTTVHDVVDAQQRVQATAGVRWLLEPARNIPPADPQAAQVDIAETLNQYLLAVNNTTMLLQQRQVARPTLDDYIARYNAALRRFLRVRDAYDGSLARSWPAPVLPAWGSLRDELWAVHQTFWGIDPQMADVYKREQTTPELRAQMTALEPDLKHLEKDIADFMHLLAKGPTP
jgi:hypothetical protein